MKRTPALLLALESSGIGNELQAADSPYALHSINENNSQEMIKLAAFQELQAWTGEPPNIWSFGVINA